jgi:putative transposase
VKYDPEKHKRRSIRLKGHDYVVAGTYFITLCTYQRECLFGKIADGVMQLNPLGEIVENCWNQIPQHFPNAQSKDFVVMPNHFHGILMVLQDDHDRRGMAVPCPYMGEFGKPVAGSLPTMIGSLKSAIAKRINIHRNALGTPVWQRNYYEHIIRNDLSLQTIQTYIRHNPQSWQTDRLHPDNPSK